MGAPQRGIKNRKAGRIGIGVGSAVAIGYDLTKGRNIIGQGTGRFINTAGQALGGLQKAAGDIVGKFKHAVAFGKGDVKMLPANAGTGKPPFDLEKLPKAELQPKSGSIPKNRRLNQPLLTTKTKDVLGQSSQGVLIEGGKKTTKREAVKQGLKKAGKYAGKKIAQGAVLSGPVKHPAVIGAIGAGSTVYDMYKYIKKNK
tara:strand:- start:339 stop:938 length:600 start_codon:yes stop_codon:yes gene_type:complete